MVMYWRDPLYFLMFITPHVDFVIDVQLVVFDLAMLGGKPPMDLSQTDCLETVFNQFLATTCRF